MPRIIRRLIIKTGVLNVEIDVGINITRLQNFHHRYIYLAEILNAVGIIEINLQPNERRLVRRSLIYKPLISR